MAPVMNAADLCATRILTAIFLSDVINEAVHYSLTSEDEMYRVVTLVRLALRQRGLR